MSKYSVVCVFDIKGYYTSIFRTPISVSFDVHTVGHSLSCDIRDRLMEEIQSNLKMDEILSLIKEYSNSDKIFESLSVNIYYKNPFDIPEGGSIEFQGGGESIALDLMNLLCEAFKKLDKIPTQ